MEYDNGKFVIYYDYFLNIYTQTHSQVPLLVCVVCIVQLHASMYKYTNGSQAMYGKMNLSPFSK